jgi:hypothetical protein
VVEGLSDVEPEGGLKEEIEHVGPVRPSNTHFFDFTKFKD